MFQRMGMCNKLKRVSRREFLGQSSGVIVAVGSAIYLNPFEVFKGDPEADLKWDKAPCRFCGTGCSVLVGVENGKIMAVKVDPES